MTRKELENSNEDIQDMLDFDMSTGRGIFSINLNEKEILGKSILNFTYDDSNFSTQSNNISVENVEEENATDRKLATVEKILNIICIFYGSNI